MGTISPLLPPAASGHEPLEQGSSLWRDAWHRLRKNKLAVTGGLLLIVLVLLCVVGPFFSQSYQDQNLNLGATPPSREHWSPGRVRREVFARRA